MQRLQGGVSETEEVSAELPPGELAHLYGGQRRKSFLEGKKIAF